MNEIKILGIVGSTRQGSYNRLALEAARELVPAGVVLDLIELHGMPYFEQSIAQEAPAPVLRFKQRVLAADAILFSTPECNHAVPGSLKSAIDWASGSHCAWQNKPAGIICASVGKLATGRAQHHLRRLLATLNMPIVNQPATMNGNAEQRFGPDGKLTDEPTRQSIRELLVALVELVKSNSAASGWIAREAA
jgi:chromate reductase, NAD(P)H dehydrogenase (quinone)